MRQFRAGCQIRTGALLAGYPNRSNGHTRAYYASATADDGSATGDDGSATADDNSATADDSATTYDSTTAADASAPGHRGPFGTAGQYALPLDRAFRPGPVETERDLSGWGEVIKLDRRHDGQIPHQLHPRQRGP